MTPWKVLAACGLICLANGAVAQAPAPVPALPDSPRLIQYSISASTCACSVNFALYGTGTDVDDWVQVYINGVAKLSTDLTSGWSLSSITGSLSVIPRPITNAVLTFNSPQTGTIVIVGSERPRRLSQFSENRGVPARDLNQAITDTIAVQREIWDKSNRSIVGQPGEVLTPLPSAAARANQALIFDANGNPALTGAVVPTSVISSANSWTQLQTFTGGINIVNIATVAPTTITAAAGDIVNSVFSVKKTLSFLTPGGASSGVFAAIDGAVTIGEGTWSNQIGVIGHVYNSNTQHSQPGSTASAVATYGVAVCEVVSCSATWGGVMAAYDLSGQSGAPNPLIGLEVDNYAHGVGSGNRIGLQIVAGTPDGLGTLNSVDSGILFTGNGAASTGQFINLINSNTAKMQNGVVLSASTITGFAWLSPGASIDGTGHAQFQNAIIPQVYGGGGSPSTLFLTSTSNGAPSGDSIALRASSIQLQNTLATATFVAFTPTLATFGDGVPTHIATQQTTPPALTSCGTTPAITGTDTAGIVTMGTTATGCVITFNVAYVAAPYCVVTWIATPLASQSYVTSNAAITLTQTSTSNNKVQYICTAQSGG